MIEAYKKEEKSQESDDRDEKDNLDEKDGKEELDEDKKKEVDERKRQKGENKEELDYKEKGNEEVKEEANNKENKKEETPKKEEYLAKRKKLHEMIIVDYKAQMKTGEVDIDRYYMSILVLQKSLNIQRQAFIKEYGADELTTIENKYLQEENKYRRTIVNNIETSLAKLRALDEKLEAILAEKAMLEKQLEDESIPIDVYNDKVDVLEKDELNTLWQINRLNPELLEEMQDNLVLRGKLERRTTTSSLEKEKRRDMSSLNKARTVGLKYDEKKQEGRAEQANDNREAKMQEVIEAKDERIYEIKKEIDGLNMNKPEDRKRAGLLIEELYSIKMSKESAEEKKEILEKNMKAGIQDYGELKEPEAEREDSVEEFSNQSEKIDYTNQTPEFMEQYKDDVIELSGSDDARELLDNMDKIAEEAEKESNKEKEEPDEYKERTRNRYRYSSNN